MDKHRTRLKHFFMKKHHIGTNNINREQQNSKTLRNKRSRGLKWTNGKYWNLYEPISIESSKVCPLDALSSLVIFLLQACMSPHRGVSPHGAQHPPGPLDTTPSMSDRLFRLGLAESQVRKKCSDVHFKTVSQICISI